MAISVFPTPSATTAGDNWVQIATSTPNSGSSVSFTSIPTTYKKLWLVTVGPIVPSTSAVLSLTVNSITAADSYRYFYSGPTTTATAFVRTTFISSLAGTSQEINCIFENPTFGLPFAKFNGGFAHNASAGRRQEGWIASATSVITQIDATLDTGNFTTNTGTFYLYGTE